jgi:hypothetical protein
MERSAPSTPSGAEVVVIEKNAGGRGHFQRKSLEQQHHRRSSPMRRDGHD